MRRFYRAATVAEEAEGFAVALDGRIVRTPAGAPLRLPTRALAEALAEEWAGQGDEVVPQSMRLMQIASTAIDRVRPSRDGVVDELVRFAGTDLLCYRAEQPADLARRQAETWQPVLDWAVLTFDAPLVVTAGVMPVAQPPEALAALRRAVAAYDEFRLTALHTATAAMGSLVLGLAVVERRLRAREAFEASILDERYQIELWGDDPEAAGRREALAADVEAAARFAALCAG